MIFNILAYLIPLLNFLVAIFCSKYTRIFILKQFLIFTNIFKISLFLILFFKVLNTMNIFSNYFWTWFELYNFKITISLNLNTLNISMLLMISIVASMVFVYSIYYMEQDPNINIFWAYIALFEFLMYILVTSENFLTLFIGWEGIGICSYLLIGFWSTRLAATKAAIKAVIVNSLGDVCLLTAMALCLKTYQTLDFTLIKLILSKLNNETLNCFGFDILIITLLNFLILIAITSKSAQIGLHIWLSDAMEGPTPVSALIHAATMVTAGIYLIIKFSIIFELNLKIFNFLWILGCITSLLSSLIALTQNDIKKVIAFSTCSQLGYMLFACGLSSYNAAFFHLITHAFYKALLFLTAGAIIHSLAGEQDLRKMGFLKNKLNLTFIFFFFGSLSLIGFPFLSGFYSKEFILELSQSIRLDNTIVYIGFIFGAVTAGLTAFYSTRVLFLAFFQKTSIKPQLWKHIHEINVGMTIPLTILFFGAIFIGFFLKDIFVGPGSFYLQEIIFINLKNFSLINAEFIQLSYKQIPLFISIFGVTLSLIFYKSTKNTIIFFFLFQKNLIYNIYNLLINKIFFDTVYNNLVLKILYFSNYYCLTALHQNLNQIENLILQTLFKISNFLKTKLIYINFIKNLISIYFITIFFSIFWI
jgi:proton-translocating NADH-quinone oxidoreductase chain L